MARSDLDALLNTALPFAQELLAKRGAFYPFGAAMKVDGQVNRVAGYTGEEFPDSQELINLLRGAYQAQAAKGELKATVLCFDVRTIPPGQAEKTDAICVRLEHADGEAVDVLLPYSKNALGDISYGELFAVKGGRSVFAMQSGSGS
jgi:hypothetical protein